MLCLLGPGRGGLLLGAVSSYFTGFASCCACSGRAAGACFWAPFHHISQVSHHVVLARAGPRGLAFGRRFIIFHRFRIMLCLLGLGRGGLLLGAVSSYFTGFASCCACSGWAAGACFWAPFHHIS